MLLHPLGGSPHKGVKLALLRCDITGATIAMSSVTKSGTAPPTLVLSGAPDGAGGPAIIGKIMRFEITLRGARGVAEFRWTRDYQGAATVWDEEDVVTSASDALDDTGVTAEWGTGTDYEVDNVFVATALGPAAATTSDDGYIGDRGKVGYVQGWRRTDEGIWTFYGQTGMSCAKEPNVHPSVKKGGSSATTDWNAVVQSNNWTANPPNLSIVLIDKNGNPIDPGADDNPSLDVTMWMPDSSGNV